jgi:plasmid stability protein
LKERARERGRSVEAEHRAILEAATAVGSSSEDFIAAMRGLTWLADMDPEDLTDPDDLGREFDHDPEHGTTVRHVRRAPRHDRPD